MNLKNMPISLLAVSLFALSAVVADPTVTREDPALIVVSGADLAGILPYTNQIEVTDGTRMLDGWVFGDQIAYVVDPYVDYTIHTFTRPDGEPEDSPRTSVEFDMSLTPENRLDHVIEQRIIWEREFIRMMAEDGYNFFDLSAAMQRVHDRFEN